MILKSFFNDMNITNEDKFYLIFLTCFAIVITLMMIQFNSTRGAFNSDVYVYLSAALDFAGLNYNHISNPGFFQNSPVILFLTAILFKLGFIDIKSIFIVTGLFGIIGIIGMYIFLKIRFSPLLSLTGAILFSSLSLTLYYFANGMLDVPAVSMIIWVLIFTVMAVNKNPKYYILVSISFSMAFFVRYTTSYIISLIVLYVLKKYDIIHLIECMIFDKKVFNEKILLFIKSKEFKWMLFSVFIGVIIFIVIFAILLSYFPHIDYLNMARGSINKFNRIYEANYVPDKFFYIKNFLSLLSSASINLNIKFVEKFNNPTFFAYLTVFILAMGIILKSMKFFKNLDNFKRNIISIDYRNKNTDKILIISMFLSFIISILGFKFNYLISLIFAWLFFIILMSYIKKYPIDYEKFTLSILCLALFSFYMIIFSYINLKCVRYILPVFPAFVYFVICSLDVIIKVIRDGFDNNRLDNKFISNRKTSFFRKKIGFVIPIILILISLFFAFTFTSTVEINEDSLIVLDICDFMESYDHNLESKSILYERWDLRNFEWYLNKNIYCSDEMDCSDLNSFDYIITFDEPINEINFDEIYHKGHYHVYENNHSV